MDVLNMSLRCLIQNNTGCRLITVTENKKETRRVFMLILFLV